MSTTSSLRPSLRQQSFPMHGVDLESPPGTAGGFSYNSHMRNTHTPDYWNDGVFCRPSIKQNPVKRSAKSFQTFEKKLKHHIDDFVNIDLLGVRNTTGLTLLIAAMSDPDKIGVDLTDEPSVFITLIYPDDRAIYLESFFEPGTDKPVQFNLIVYQNKESIYAYSGTFEETLSVFLQQTDSIKSKNKN